MATTQLPPGIYRIAVARGSGSTHELLTRESDSRVTILPPGAKPDPEQEWSIVHGKEPGTIIIAIPSAIRPTSYLTYKGAPHKPKEHDRVEYHVSEFPPNEWHPTIAPGFAFYLRVAGSELGIKLGPEKIHPPFLVLGLHELLEWRFELVRPHE